MKERIENNSGSGNKTAHSLIERSNLDGVGSSAIAAIGLLNMPNLNASEGRKHAGEAGGIAEEIKQAVYSPEDLPALQRVGQVVDKVIVSSYPARVAITALLIEELTLDKSEPGSGLRIMESLGVDKKRKKQTAEIFYLALKDNDGEKNPLLGRLKKTIGKRKITLTPQESEIAKAEADAKNLRRKIMRLQKEIVESYLPIGNYKLGESDPRLFGLLDHLGEFYSRRDERGKLASENISLQSLYLFAEERLQYFSSKFPEKRSVSDQPDKTEKEYWATVKANLELLIESQSSRGR